MREEELDPTHIMQVGMGFFGSRTLLTAVELGLFTELGAGKMSGARIAERLGLHPRAIPDFPDALVALGLLRRDGDGPDALYGNTAETAVFLDKEGANYIGGILEMSSSRLCGFWNNLTEALETGEPQNEIKETGEPIAKKHIEAAGLLHPVSTAVVDFFKDPLPKADVITVGMILHDWNLEKKKHLIKLAYDALPPGGAFIVVEALIDDARRENAFGLLMSLNMLIEFGDAFDYSGADFNGWCSEAGFDRFEVIPLAGPSSAAVAHKPG